MDVKILAGDEQEIEMRELDEEDEPANEKLGFDLSVDEGNKSNSSS
jgi:DNA-directed RNA polymerase subunit beta